MTTITRAQDFHIVDVQPMVGLVAPRQAKIPYNLIVGL